jgi:hypothetical protein
VTPIQKVITLLTELNAQCKTSKAAEEVLFATKSQQCTSDKSTTQGSIDADNANIEKHSAAIEVAAALIKTTDNRIKELDEDLARWTKDKKSATTVREAERADFTATNTDYGESVDALTAAEATMKKQDVTTDQAQFVQTTLIQVQSRHRSRAAPPMPAALQAQLDALTQDASSSSDSLSDSVGSALADSSAALAQTDESDGAAAQTPAAGYEFQSGGVLDLLTKLKDQFTTEKTNLETEELAAENAYTAVMQQLSSNIAGGQTELDQKKILLTTTQQGKADSEGDLETSKTSLETDTTSLQTITSACTIATSDFNAADKLRGEEVEAIEQALKIIDSDSVAGAGTRNLPQFLQIKSKSVYAHLRSELQNDPEQGKLIVFLSERARSLSSTLLLDIAQRAKANPFTKVKKMVKDLMVKLMEEATAEMEHKGWCDTELTTNKMTRDKKSADVDSLTLEVEDLTATISRLGQESSDLAAEVAEMDKEAEATSEMRSQTKAANAASIKDAKAAITAVEQAMSVLKDFYARSAESAALIQASADPTSQAEGGGIVDMLEVILSDFTRLDSETTAAEATDLQSFKERMFQYKKDRALKAQQISQKDEKKTDKSSALHSAQVDLKSTEESLDKAEKYYKSIKPQCVDSGITYGERKQKREEEIQSLEEALKILQP